MKDLSLTRAHRVRQRRKSLAAPPPLPGARPRWWQRVWWGGGRRRRRRRQRRRRRRRRRRKVDGRVARGHVCPGGRGAACLLAGPAHCCRLQVWLFNKKRVKRHRTAPGSLRSPGPAGGSAAQARASRLAPRLSLSAPELFVFPSFFLFSFAPAPRGFPRSGFPAAGRLVVGPRCPARGCCRSPGTPGFRCPPLRFLLLEDFCLGVETGFLCVL